MLLVSYINIIISILIAYSVNAFRYPRQNILALDKQSLKNILVFPATVGMFILAFILSDLSKISGDQNLWVPPLLGLWGEKTSQAIGGVLGFGIILMTPKVADIIKSMFEKKPFAYGAAIGEPLKAPIKGLNLLAQSAETIDTFYKEAKSGVGGIKKLSQRRKNPNVTTGLPSSNQP